MLGCLKNNELEGMWKEVVVALFEVVSINFSGGTAENLENPQDIRYLGRGWNLALPNTV
jgi:hypothetical protein